MPDADLLGHALSPGQVLELAAASGQGPDRFDPELARGLDLVLASLMNLAPRPGQPASPYMAFRSGDSDTLDLVFSFAYTPQGAFSFQDLYENSPNSALFLNTRDADFYQNGIPGVTGSIEETVSWLAAIRDRVGFRRVRTIGMSMGGYAAILFGDLLDADDIYAFSPAIDGRFVFVGQHRAFADATARLRRTAERSFISFGAHELSDYIGFHHCLNAGLPIEGIHRVCNGHGGVPAFRLDRLVAESGRLAAEPLIATPHPARLAAGDVALLAEAMLAVNAGESERVVALIGDVLRRDPHNPGLCYRLGVHLALAGRPGAARAAFAGSARLYADLARLLGGDHFGQDGTLRRRLIRDYAHLLDYDRLRAVAALLDDAAPEASCAGQDDPWRVVAEAIDRREKLSILAFTRDEASLLAQASPATAALARGGDILRAARRNFGAQACDADVERLGGLLARAFAEARGIFFARAAWPTTDPLFRVLEASIEGAARPPALWRRDGQTDLDADHAALARVLAGERFLGIVAPTDSDDWAARLSPNAEILWAAPPLPEAASHWHCSARQNIDTMIGLAEALPVPFPGAVFVLAAGVAGKLAAPSLRRRGAIVIDIAAPPAPSGLVEPNLGSGDRAGLMAWAIAEARRRASGNGPGPPDVDGALRLLADARRLEPHHAAVALERVALLIAAGRADQAAAAARAMAAGAADPAWVAWRCAALLDEAGHPDAARDLLEAALRARPMSARLLAAHAMVFARAPRLDPAGAARPIATDFLLNRIEHHEGAADDPALARAAGHLLQARGDAAGARAALERAVAMASFDHAAVSDLARGRLAAGDRLGAREAAILAALLEPDAPEALALFLETQ